MEGVISELKVKTAGRIRELRDILKVSANLVAEGVGISASTLASYELGERAGNTDVLAAIIFFYGFTYKEFFDFSKPLPNKEKLIARMKKFHESQGSESYKMILKAPDLIYFIEYELLFTKLFDDWVDSKTVIKFCFEEYKFEYSPTSVPNTLELAVTKKWLEFKSGSSPKAYRKKR